MCTYLKFRFKISLLNYTESSHFISIAYPGENLNYKSFTFEQNLVN